MVAADHPVQSPIAAVNLAARLRRPGRIEEAIETLRYALNGPLPDAADRTRELLRELGNRQPGDSTAKVAEAVDAACGTALAGPEVDGRDDPDFGSAGPYRQRGLRRMLRTGYR